MLYLTALLTVMALVYLVFAMLRPESF
ncbi:potassium-transporting ATPase subunit F [Singulisphaera sp. GP187]